MASPKLTLDMDVIRLITYREVLRAIARRADLDPWEIDPTWDDPAEMARAALQALGDWET